MKTDLHSLVNTLRRHRKELEDRFGVKHISIFGSFVREEQTENSDVDILISFKKTPTLIELVELKEYLENLIGLKVDLITEKGISPYVRPYIEREKVGVI